MSVRLIAEQTPLLTDSSVDDDDKLRDKVNDALNVYNEYLKTAPRQQGEGNQSEATHSDENANHDGEETAQAET